MKHGLYRMSHKTYRWGWLNTSSIEVWNLLKAWTAISLAFAILLNRGFALNQQFLIVLVTAAFTVGVGFLLHEMGHKIVAQHYGLFAEFRSFDPMLLLAIFFSFFGFILAAPGAVMINGRVSVEQNGKISLAGPLVNLVLALLFFAALQAKNLYALRVGLAINAVLAIFNLLPFGNFDGKKLFVWSKEAWGGMVALGVVCMYLSIQQGWLG